MPVLMRIGVFLSLALAVAGCADRWTGPGTTQQIDAALYQCQRENRNFSDGSVIGPHGDFAQEDMVRQCMRARGYTLSD